uniref:Uncharacterized protein n=1 Tax=Capra hircus TaxID=9925 RepID=A0A8C2RZS5_CAPHI
QCGATHICARANSLLQANSYSGHYHECPSLHRPGHCHLHSDFRDHSQHLHRLCSEACVQLRCEQCDQHPEQCDQHHCFRLPALPLWDSPDFWCQLHPSSSSSSSSTGFSGFGSSLSTSAPATTGQPTLTFSSTATPAFNIPFASGTKPTLPSYPGANPQPTFGAAEGQPQGAAKPALVPSFGSSFTFGNSAAPTPTATPAPTPAQPAFGGAAQPAFGSLKATPSAFGTSTSTRPAFGSTTAVFSFGAATTSGFGATTQTTSSGTSGSVFGGTTPSPFMFGGPATPAGSGAFGMSVATPGTSAASGAFGFGAGQSGTTGSTAPFGGGLSQNSLGTPSQTTSFAFSVTSAPDSKPVFGGTSTPTFGQNTCPRLCRSWTFWIDSPFLFHWCGIQDPRGSTAATGPEAAHPQEIAFVPHPAPHHPLPKSRPRHLLGRASDPSGSATQTNPRPLASARREVVAAPGAVSLSGSRSPRSGGSWGEGCGRAEAVTLLEQLNW